MFTEQDPGVQVDKAHFPLVIKRVGAFIGPKEMEAYLREFSGLLERKQPFACVVIVKKRGKMEWSILNDWASWSKTNDQRLRDFCKGVAFVFPGDAFRLLLSAILSVSSGKVPYKVFSDQSTAYAWATEQLAPSGYRAPTPRPALWP